MAASTTRRVSCVSLLLSVISLHIPVQISANKSNPVIHNVNSQQLEDISLSNEHVLAFFHDGKCVSEACQHTKMHVGLAKDENKLPALKVVGIHDDAKAKELGINKYPNLVFFHNGSPNVFPGEVMEIEEIIEWIEGPADKIIIPLDDTNFEHQTQAASGATTGDWFIIFYKSTCSQILPELQAAANRVKGRVVVGRVDMTYSPQLVKRFKLTNCPTLKYFRHGNMYDFNLPKYDVQTLTKFAEGWYKNSRMAKVPPELTPFDHLVEQIVLALKDAIEERQLFPLLAGGGTVTLILALFCLYLCSSSRREKTE